jgi:hypothetical protein
MEGVRKGTTVPDNGSYGGVVATKTLGRLKVGWVQVLRPVREEVKA